ncbi:MAG: OFA family MFS transporter [Vicinamibacterales bacterium]
MPQGGWLDKSRIVAPASYDRWLVPPAALAVHLSIGMAYGFSVFWLPLSRAIGVSAPAPDDWKISTLGWMYTLFFVFLGSSAAVFGRWVEREGPRKAGVVAAVCWGGGFFLSALGVRLHQIWLLWIGAGVIGGCGLGLGYISPVSTLIKWFPDRRGLATGLAIMGFGGGAMIGTPLADALMKYFATPSSVGVWQTFVTMGALYTLAIVAGAMAYRLPPAGWTPRASTPTGASSAGPTTGAAPRSLPVNEAFATRQFWLLWAVLCLNVTAGIGVLGMAVPMIQEVFKDRVTASAAAGFAGLLSVFNILGRIAWASLSDVIGRRGTYTVFFALGLMLYAAAPSLGHLGSAGAFVAVFCVILTMYGGGFATIPAYLADLFGPDHVGAIHGRLLTAWSTAGVLGPVLVNYLREFQIARGVPNAAAYDGTMYILAALLGLGFVCNWAITPLASRARTTSSPELAAETPVVDSSSGGVSVVPVDRHVGQLLLRWTLVLVPIAWGIYRTLVLAMQLFT